MAWQYQFCPTCHVGHFHVRTDHDGRTQLVCGGCGAVVLDNQPDVPAGTATPAPQWRPI